MWAAISDTVTQFEAQTYTHTHPPVHSQFPTAHCLPPGGIKPAVTLHYRTQSGAVSSRWTCTVTYTMCPHSVLASSDSSTDTWCHISSVTLSADNPGGGQRSGQDLSAGSVRPGQVHPRILHLHRRHWFHSESILPTPSHPEFVLFLSCSPPFSTPPPPHPTPCYAVDFTRVMRRTCQCDGLLVLKLDMTAKQIFSVSVLFVCQWSAAWIGGVLQCGASHLLTAFITILNTLGEDGGCLHYYG